MFMSNWIFAILAIFIGIAVYKYIEYQGCVAVLVLSAFDPYQAAFQRREGVGRRHPRPGPVGRPLRAAEPGGGAAAHQELAVDGL